MPPAPTTGMVAVSITLDFSELEPGFKTSTRIAT
jgi:hypothetical protein